jgi:DNA replication protein DnaC
MSDSKVEFVCIGAKAFVGGYSNKNGVHTYQDAIENLNPHPYDPNINHGLCKDCRVEVSEIWFKSIVTDRLQGLSFDTFLKEHNTKAYKAARSFKIENGNSILFWSESWGTGKTHLSVSIVREYLKQYMLNYNLWGQEFTKHKCPANIITEAELVNKIRASFDDENSESESEIVHRYTDVKLLLLDDVGKTTFAKDDFINRIYFLIIDRLYNKKISLIVTCNGGLVSIGRQIGQACISRLYEMCGDNRIEVPGKDFRREGK